MTCFWTKWVRWWFKHNYRSIINSLLGLIICWQDDLLTIRVFKRYMLSEIAPFYWVLHWTFSCGQLVVLALKYFSHLLLTHAFVFCFFFQTQLGFYTCVCCPCCHLCMSCPLMFVPLTKKPWSSVTSLTCCTVIGQCRRGAPDASCTRCTPSRWLQLAIFGS